MRAAIGASVRSILNLYCKDNIIDSMWIACYPRCACEREYVERRFANAHALLTRKRMHRRALQRKEAVLWETNQTFEPR